MVDPSPFESDERTNEFLENFMGGNIPKFDGRSIDTEVYTFLKPCIYYVYDALNNNDQGKITELMHKILVTYSNVEGFLQGAATSGVIPPNPTDTPAYRLAWYNMVFKYPNGEQKNAADRLKLVIQGGEAVNRYTRTFYENVITHDCDTRLLVGDHFNYNTPIESVREDIKTSMYRYRFLALYSVLVEARSFTIRVLGAIAQNPPDETAKTYMEKTAPTWYQDANRTQPRFFVGGNGKIINGNWVYNQYDRMVVAGQAGTYNLNELVCVWWLLDEGGLKNNANSLIDFFIPRRSDMLGHSPDLHKYFSSPQAQGIRDHLPAERLGAVPHLIFSHSMTTPMPTQNPPVQDTRFITRIYGTGNYNTFIVPIGYLLWDTLRMSFVSLRLQRAAERGEDVGSNKLTKYIQKLTVLLTTLLNKGMSAKLLETTFEEKTRNPALQPYLLGGRVADVQTDTLVQTEMPIVAKRIDESQAITKPTPTMEPAYPIETIREARALAAKFLESKEPVTSDNLKTPVEMLAYGQYMSFADGGWSDLRLRLLPEEVASIQTFKLNDAALTQPGLSSPILPQEKAGPIAKADIAPQEKAGPIVEAPPMTAPPQMANGGSRPLYRKTRQHKSHHQRTLRKKRSPVT